MVNNIYKLKNNKTLTTDLGETTSNITSADLTQLSGIIGNGLLIFDKDGTIAVVSDYVDDNNFIVRTYALSIDIDTILGGSY